MADEEKKEVETSTEERKWDPEEYFEFIKSKKQTMTDDYLNKLYNIILKETSKAMVVGQDMLVQRLAYTLSVLEREHELVAQGVDTFVHREDIQKFIKSVENKVVKIIELEFFPRAIPDEVIDKIAKLKEKNIFDRFYIVFTDYTGEAESKVKEERRRKDPIVFGTFEQKIDRIWDIHDRFYYIGDWEDEYCDLTLAKMVEHMANKGDDILRHTVDVATPETIRAYVGALKEAENKGFVLNKPKDGAFKSISTKVSEVVKTIKKKVSKK